MNLILLGAPGAGKGTQAEVICKHLSIPAVSTGNMIREALKNGTEMGLKAKSYMDDGKLVPDEVVIGIVKERLSEDDCKKGFILDGFPRTIFQAEHFDNFLKGIGQELDAVVDIEVSEEILLPRLTGRLVCRNCGKPYHRINTPPKVEGVCDVCGGEVYQRADDSEETVLNRFKVYNEQTSPLIEYYTNSGKLLPIDGEKTQKEVFEEICAKLGD